jgi:hypothetical protein
MEILKNKKAVVSIVALLIIAGFGLYFMTRGSGKSIESAKVQEIAPTPTPDEVKPLDSNVKVTLKSITPLKEVKLLIEGVPNKTRSIEYELQYVTKTKPSDGVFGNAKPKEGSDFFGTDFERSLNLGTCSRNVCRYSEITSPLTVRIRMEGEYGAQAAEKEFPLSTIQ